MGTKAHVIPRFYLEEFVDDAVPEGHQPFLWIRELTSDRTLKRAPKNWGVKVGYYDGPGGFAPTGPNLEQRLSRVESDAAVALREWLARPVGKRGPINGEIHRFICWMGARTVHMVDHWENFIRDAILASGSPVEMGDALPPHTYVVDALGAERRDCSTFADARVWLERGWLLRLDPELARQVMSLQASKFHELLSLLSHWTSLDAPTEHEGFVTSDRPLFWFAKGLSINSKPAYIRHDATAVMMPLSSRVAVVGTHHPVDPEHPVHPNAVNGLIAAHAHSWIAGSSQALVNSAIEHRAKLLSED